MGGGGDGRLPVMTTSTVDRMRGDKGGVVTS